MNNWKLRIPQKEGDFELLAGQNKVTKDSVKWRLLYDALRAIRKKSSMMMMVMMLI